jgi:hypothetical protein
MPSSAVDALLHEAGLIDDEDPVGIADLVGDIAAKVVADRVGVPACCVEQSLHLVRSPVTGRLGQGPAVLVRQRRQQPEQVARRLSARLYPTEPRREDRHQILEAGQPTRSGVD